MHPNFLTADFKWYEMNFLLAQPAQKVPKVWILYYIVRKIKSCTLSVTLMIHPGVEVIQIILRPYRKVWHSTNKLITLDVFSQVFESSISCRSEMLEHFLVPSSYILKYAASLCFMLSDEQEIARCPWKFLHLTWMPSKKGLGVMATSGMFNLLIQ